MCSHQLQQLSIAEVPVRDELFVRRLLRTENILRSQPCLPQKTFQLRGRERLLEVINCLKFDPLLSQDTPDLPASASGWLLVNSNRVLLHVVTILQAESRATPNRSAQIALSLCHDYDL